MNLFGDITGGETIGGGNLFGNITGDETICAVVGVSFFVIVRSGATLGAIRSVAARIFFGNFKVAAHYAKRGDFFAKLCKTTTNIHNSRKRLK